MRRGECCGICGLSLVFFVRRRVEYQASKSEACNFNTCTSPNLGHRMLSMAARMKRRFDGDQSKLRCSNQASRSSLIVIEWAAPSPMPYLAAVRASQRSASDLVGCVDESCLGVPLVESLTVRRACQLFPRLRVVPCMCFLSMGSVTRFVTFCDNGYPVTRSHVHFSQ